VDIIIAVVAQSSKRIVMFKGAEEGQDGSYLFAWIEVEGGSPGVRV
jgi:hypothetical protein